MLVNYLFTARDRRKVEEYARKFLIVPSLIYDLMKMLLKTGRDESIVKL